MSRENLPTNYVNYELATAMGGMRRFNQINNSDGTISFEDATTYSTTGTTYGASEINTANALINEINELVGVTSISGSGQTDITSLLGGTDITESTLGIGDGTVTGAISELNSNLTNKQATIKYVQCYKDATQTNSDYTYGSGDLYRINVGAISSFTNYPTGKTILATIPTGGYNISDPTFAAVYDASTGWGVVAYLNRTYRFFAIVLYTD